MGKSRILPLLAVLLSLAAAPACGPSLREQSRIDYDNQVNAIKTVGMISPDMLIYELSAGGVQEQMDEWCDAASQNFSDVVKKELNARSVNVKGITLDENAVDDEEIIYLFRAITDSLQWNKTYRKLSLCEDERICKDFAFGPVDRIFNRYKVDALLMVLGYNEMETSARAKARKRSRVLSKLSAFGPVRFAPLRGPGTYVSMALVNRSGSVLWYGAAASNRGYDLRDPAKVGEVAKRILGRMWLKEGE